MRNLKFHGSGRQKAEHMRGLKKSQERGEGRGRAREREKEGEEKKKKEKFPPLLRIMTAGKLLMYR